jgi:hypothetical protein
MGKLSTGMELKLKNETKIEIWQPIRDFDLKAFILLLLTGLPTSKFGPGINGKLKRVTLLKKRIGRTLSLNCRRSSNEYANMD